MNDTTTLILSLLYLPLWLGLEIFLIARRGQGVRIGTISMVMRDRAAHMSSVVYLHGGMASHWYWPGDYPATVWGSIVFWVALLAFLVQDIYLWKVATKWWPMWLQWQRKPILILALGFIAGKLLFPQVG